MIQVGNRLTTDNTKDLRTLPNHRNLRKLNKSKIKIMVKGANRRRIVKNHKRGVIGKNQYI